MEGWQVPFVMRDSETGCGGMGCLITRSPVGRKHALSDLNERYLGWYYYEYHLKSS